jgi:uracil-DNA glycosylase
MSEISLRQAMHALLQDWRNDISLEWREALNDVEPAFAQVRNDLLLRDGEVVFPGRRGASRTGAPAGAHIFKSLDRLAPENVKAVVIGQDPYPRVSRATGRAFEQGDLSGWAGTGNLVTTSMKRLLQVASHQRTGDTGYLAASGWNKVQSDLSSGGLNFLPPHAQFDAWEDAGVLWLNAGLTLSHYEQGGAPEQAFGHIPLWQPIVRQIIRHLVRRSGRRVVFLVWGGFARKVLIGAGVENEPTWGTTAGGAEYPHPATTAFLDPPNPLAKANTVRSELGSTPITW